mmetsp:Transcript_19324/g.51426  ORF Transcript_19324/g.51426 Transcript_19324/m.51426 type:complete len:782 (-) Transcript_19324:247-2592(-)
MIPTATSAAGLHLDLQDHRSGFHLAYSREEVTGASPQPHGALPPMSFEVDGAGEDDGGCQRKLPSLQDFLGLDSTTESTLCSVRHAVSLGSSSGWSSPGTWASDFDPDRCTLHQVLPAATASPPAAAVAAGLGGLAAGGGSPKPAADSQVPAEQFQQPCRALCTNGGTAAFFEVRYLPDQRPAGIAENFYVGKDLAHARDEKEFYERLSKLQALDPRWAAFAEVAMGCPGCTELQCIRGAADKPEERQLLLLENLRVGFKQLRLLDVKLGEKTSVVGWKGKTRLHAWKNQVIDYTTNSAREGFRLEGMDLLPKSLRDRMSHFIQGRHNQGIPILTDLLSEKRSKRMLQQQLRAHEFLASWLDMGPPQAGVETELHAHGALWGAIDAVARIVKAVVNIPVPQQWIGTSLALGVEVEDISKQPRVVAKVFDWGRAELTTGAEYKELQAEEKKERLGFWRQYVRAISRFQWELCRTYAHRSCCKAWTAFVFEIHTSQCSIVRKSVLGDTGGDIGSAVYELPTRASLPEGGKNLVVPLMGRPSQGSFAQLVCGMLYIHVSTIPKAEGGRSVVVTVHGATDVPEVCKSGVETTVRVIAFEHVEDAKWHLEATQAGEEERTPRGRAYELRTRPGRSFGRKLLFEDTMEFLGLGEKRAQEAQRKLEEMLPEECDDSEDEMSICPTCSPMAGDRSSPIGSPIHFSDPEAEDDACFCGHVIDATSPGICPHQRHYGTRHRHCFLHAGGTYPELLPPTVGRCSNIEKQAAAFCSSLAAWTQEGASCPESWR